MPSLPWRLLHLLALSTLAITQPLLSILGDNPTFFTAHDSSAGQVVWFSLLIALVPTAVLGLVEVGAHLFDERFGIRVHLGLLAVLGFLFLIQVVDILPGPWLLPTVIATGLTFGLIEIYARFEPARTVASVLGITPVLFVSLFLFVSPASSIVFPDDVNAVDLGDLIDESTLTGDDGFATTDNEGDGDGPPPTLRERVNERFPPIYILVLDELPMASLLDESGEIDAARWPNFARIADTSHLFSNTTTIGFTTERAVPALLASTYETQDAPIYSLYPDNLFTLLGNIYDTSSSDPLVDLCPPSVCNAMPPQAILDLLGSADTAPASTTTSSTPTTMTVPPMPPDGGGTDDPSGSLRLLLDDAAIVFGHLAVPGGLDIGLPSIGAGWGNFGGDLGSGEAPTPTTTPTTTAEPRADDPTGLTTPTTAPLTVEVGIDPGADVDAVDIDAVNQQNTEFLDSLITDDSRVADFRAEVAAISADSVPRLHFLHLLLPHVPWRLHSNGEIYADLRLPGYLSMWDDDIDIARAGQQRHLLQLGFVDQLLGEYLDRLETEGIFDQATVIVTADHGISFVPGSRARGQGEANIGGIAGVPLFYKLPGQSEPVRHRNPVETIDIVPTIAAQLEVEPPWEFDGHDLFGPEVERDRAVWHPFSSDIPEPFQPEMDAVTADLLATFGNGTDGNLYALAGLAELIGTPIGHLIDAQTDYCWNRERPRTIAEDDGATGYLFGSMATSRSDAIDFAISVDGVLSGTARTLISDAPHRVFALADPQLWAGATIDDVALSEIIDGRLRPIASC